MTNLLYEPPLDFVEIDGKPYKVLTDFRDWLRFSDMFDDEDLDPKKRLALMFDWFVDMPPADRLTEAAKALVEFCANKYDGRTEKSQTQGRQKRVLSWSFDSAYIYAAFLSEYGIDLLAVDFLHWHVFLALFEALPDDTPIKQRMSYRAVNLAEIKDKKERQRIRRIQERVRIPQKEMSAADIGAVFG